MSYVIPTVSQCVRTLLRKIRTQQPNHTADVHGLVISPTRELTIQISKELGVVFNTCEFSLKERNVDKSEIIAESNLVKAGIIYIVEKVAAGYVYIKSGF